MSAIIQVSSKNSDTNAKGKAQSAWGEEAEISVEPQYLNGNPALRLELKSHHSVGDGSRGGYSKNYESTGVIFLDKETLLRCIDHAVQEKFISHSDLLEAQKGAPPGRGLREIATDIQKTWTITKNWPGKPTLAKVLVSALKSGEESPQLIHLLLSEAENWDGLRAEHLKRELYAHLNHRYVP